MVARYWFASKSQQASTVHVENSQQNLPSHFWNFYQSFHTDSLYQLQRIQFPLDGIIKHETKAEKHSWTKSDWKIQSTPKNLSAFTIKYNNYGSFVEELIEDNAGLFRMMRRFSKNDTTWTLIYYEEMGPIITKK